MIKADIQTIVMGAMAGQPKALEELILLLRPGLERRLAARVRDAHAREDLLQEVCFTACRTLGTLRDPARLEGWAGTIADGAVAAWLRRKYSQARLVEFLGQGAAAAAPDAGVEEDESLRRKVAAAFRSLSTNHQAVLEKHYLEGRSYTDTASLLQIQPDLVKSRLQKARNTLKRMITAMSTQEHPPIRLTRGDLLAFRAGAAHGRGSSNNHQIKGVLLEAGGGVIGTDGRALIVRKVAGLAGLQNPVLISPCEEISFPDAPEAEMSIGLTAITIATADGLKIELPLISRPNFPLFRNFIPTAWPIRTKLRTGDLMGALEELAPMLEPKHPVPRDLSISYKPAIDLHWDLAAQELTLGTGKTVGYDGTLGQIQKSLGGVAQWRFAITVPFTAQSTDSGAPASGNFGSSEMSQTPETLGTPPAMRINPAYLARAARGLGTADDDLIELRLIAWNKPLGLFSVRDESQFALVMPLNPG